MNDTTRLILQYDGLSEEVGKLYASLASSEAIREVFRRDPVGVIVNSLSKQVVNLPESVISLSNMLLFALLSNKQFVVWAQNYGDNARCKVTDEHPYASPQEIDKLLIVTFDKRKIQRDLTEAMLTFIDAPILHALIASNVRKVHPPEFQAATTPIRDSFSAAPSENVLVSENIAIVHNAVAAANVVAVFNHVFVAGSDIEVVAPTISRNDLEVLTRLFAEQMFTHANELRENNLLASPDAFERRAQ